MKKFFLISLILILASCTSSETLLNNTEATSTILENSSDILSVKSYEELPLALVRIEVNSTRAELTDDLEIEIFEYKGSGSGFFISSDGYIVTNNHVISGAVTIDVFTQIRSQPYKAQLIGSSECDDLAILKIDINDTKYLNLSRNEPKLGEEIIAAGFPRGDEEVTFLNGIVSKKQTDGSTSWASIEYAFEHTAEILPGSSGGPIVNTNVEVIGIAYAGNNDRQEFGIPIVLVQEKIEQIIDNEFEYTFNTNIEQFLGAGIYIYSVDSNSPLRKVGLRGGEVITKINGLSIENQESLKIYCDAIYLKDSSNAINFEGINLDTFNNFNIEVSLNGEISNSFEVTSTNLQKNNTSKSTTTTTSPPTTTTTTTTIATTNIDTSITFSTYPISTIGITGNKVSDTEFPTICYNLAPYILISDDAFFFEFNQVGWTDSTYAFALRDSDLDGCTDALVMGPEQAIKPWVFDYWIEEVGFGGKNKYFTTSGTGLILNPDYYFLANQELITSDLNKVTIHYCPSQYNLDLHREFYSFSIPSDCPHGNFFLNYRYNKIGGGYRLVHSQTYESFVLIDNYGSRVFGP